MHIHQVELILTGVLGVLFVFLVEEIVQGTFLNILTILLGCHQRGHTQVRIAHLLSDVINVQRIVILHRFADIVGHLQVVLRLRMRPRAREQSHHQ